MKIVNNLGFALFWVNHWLFTSHYLKAAYLLYLSLQGNPLTQSSKGIKEANRYLIVLDVVIYLSLLAFFVMMVVIGMRMVHIAWAMLTWLMTFVSCWSMAVIYRQTKELH